MTKQDTSDRLLQAAEVALKRLDRLDADASGEHSPAYLELKAAILSARNLKSKPVPEDVDICPWCGKPV